MLLAIDIGNSSIKFGIFDSNQLVSKFSISTKRDSTPEEIVQAIGGNLKHPITASIVSSVVPEVEESVRQFVKDRFRVEPIFVNNSFDFGLKINYEPLSAAGTDRLVNAFAAVEKYGTPVIICSFGTATTIDVVNSNGEYLGGVIAPGMNLMAEALHLKTSKLPKVEIVKPEKVVANSTIGSIQSGIYYGYIGLVEGILARMLNDFTVKPQVIATGGFATLIAPECSLIDTVDESLTMEGLRLLHKRDAIRALGR